MGLQLQQFKYLEDGKPVSESKGMELPQINDEDFKARLKEINETYKIIRDFQTGHAFEIAIVNKNQLNNGAILMPSTMFSSLTQNAGNAVELAAHGAATPHIARVYIAFPGNGGSDDLSRQDRHYFAQTGRLTRDGAALDSIAALVRALKQEGISIKNISANTEGGRLGLGIMAALPANTVSSAYFNGLPGISPVNFMIEMIKEDQEDRQWRKTEDSNEPYRVNDRTIEEAQSSLPDIYRGVDHFTRLLSTYWRAMPNQRANRKAFSEHTNLQLAETHAVLQDALTALKRQKQAKITFQFGHASKLHHIEECKKFGEKIAEELSKTLNQCSVQFFIHDGSLDFHTKFPSQRWAAEKDALMI